MAAVLDEIPGLVYTLVYDNNLERRHVMQKAKLFPNGRSQAVRLPKEFQFEGEEVYISKLNGIVMMFPVTGDWDVLLASLSMFSDDYMAERDAPVCDQDRAAL